MTQSTEQLRHWYCLNYRGTNKGGLDCLAEAYLGFREKQLKVRDIEKGKKDAGVSSNAVLVAAIYLGYMTVKQMKEDSDGIALKQIKWSSDETII